MEIPNTILNSSQAQTERERTIGAGVLLNISPPDASALHCSITAQVY